MNGIMLYILSTRFVKEPIIFDKRISISEYKVIEKESGIFLVIIGTDKDSNNDKYLNRRDLQDLFIFEVSTWTYIIVSFDEAIFSLNEAKNLCIVSYGNIF